MSKALSPEGKRVEELMKILGIKAPAMAAELGFKTPITIYNIVKGKQGISRRFVDAVGGRFPMVNTTWLMTGQGKALQKPSKSEGSTPVISRGSTAKISMIDLAAKSDPRESLANYEETRANGLFQLPSFRDCDIAINAIGESFYPEIKNGDTLFLKEVEVKKATLAGERYVAVTKDRLVAKLMNRTEDGKAIVCFDEEGIADDLVIKNDSVERLFLVKGYLSRLEY